MPCQKEIYTDAEAVAQAAARQFARCAAAAIAARGVFQVALAGGSTPRRMYQLLAAAPYRESIAWQQVQIYFGDERCVAPDHADSNYRLAWEAVLQHVPIPAQNIHRIHGEAVDVNAAAEHYAQLLRQHLPHHEGWPCFDLVLLGMGDDGHTASLFPGTPALTEQRRGVAAVYVEKFSAWRITLTYPVINRAREVIITVTGPGKAQTLRQVFNGDRAAHFPVQAIRAQGRLLWLLDEEAASSLPTKERS